MAARSCAVGSVGGGDASALSPSVMTEDMGSAPSKPLKGTSPRATCQTCSARPSRCPPSAWPMWRGGGLEEEVR
eukprot:3748432-Pleurochrysis_carterae.AAC.1